MQGVVASVVRGRSACPEAEHQGRDEVDDGRRGQVQHRRTTGQDAIQANPYAIQHMGIETSEDLSNIDGHDKHLFLSH